MQLKHCHAVLYRLCPSGCQGGITGTSLLLTYHILVNSCQCSYFKSLSEVFLFGHFPYSGRRPNLGAESQYGLSPPGQTLVSTSGWTQVQLILLLFGLLPVFKFMCGCCKQETWWRLNEPSVFREAVHAFPGFLRSGTELAVGTLLCKASVISILLQPFCRLVGVWMTL